MDDPFAARGRRTGFLPHAENNKNTLEPPNPRRIELTTSRRPFNWFPPLNQRLQDSQRASLMFK